jgi:Flp pilus assembly protein TadG
MSEAQHMGVPSIKRSSRGQASVEFALTIVFVMVIILGAIEMIMLIYTYSVLADAAKEGVRYAIVHGTQVGGSNCSGPGSTGPGVTGITCTDSSGTNVQNAVLAYAAMTFHDTSTMTITPTYPDGSSAAPSRVRVDVAYPYLPFFGLGWPSVTVNATAEGRIAF